MLGFSGFFLDDQGAVESMLVKRDGPIAPAVVCDDAQEKNYAGKKDKYLCKPGNVDSRA